LSEAGSEFGLRKTRLTVRGDEALREATIQRLCEKSVFLEFGLDGARKIGCQIADDGPEIFIPISM
jgi:hypothetical protein